MDEDESIDRTAICETVHRCAWGYDERDLDMLGSIFADDAVFDGAVAGGEPIGPHVGRDQIVAWLRGHMAVQQDQRRHGVLNELVSRPGPDEADVVAYLMLTATQDGQVRLVTTGVYR